MVTQPSKLWHHFPAKNQEELIKECQQRIYESREGIGLIVGNPFNYG